MDQVRSYLEMELEKLKQDTTKDPSSKSQAIILALIRAEQLTTIEEFKRSLRRLLSIRDYWDTNPQEVQACYQEILRTVEQLEKEIPPRHH